jgi:hypothetical protein
VPELLPKSPLAHLTTLNSDGNPQVTMVWVRVENQEFVIGHMAAPTFARCSLTAPDPRRADRVCKNLYDLLEKTYVDKIESYNNDKFIYTNEKWTDGMLGCVVRCGALATARLPNMQPISGKVGSCPVPERNDRWSKKK